MTNNRGVIDRAQVLRFGANVGPLTSGGTAGTLVREQGCYQLNLQCATNRQIKLGALPDLEVLRVGGLTVDDDPEADRSRRCRVVTQPEHTLEARVLAPQNVRPFPLLVTEAE